MTGTLQLNFEWAFNNSTSALPPPPRRMSNMLVGGRAVHNEEFFWGMIMRKKLCCPSIQAKIHRKKKWWKNRHFFGENRSTLGGNWYLASWYLNVKKMQSTFCFLTRSSPRPTLSEPFDQRGRSLRILKKKFPVPFRLPWLGVDKWWKETWMGSRGSMSSKLSP